MAEETAAGQALDIGWRQDNVTQLDEIDDRTMVMKKTCWCGTIYPARLGAKKLGLDGADDVPRALVL